ncbi:MAG: flavodoxin [Eubacterium sp.]|nr:flavodoxin [Eubacterium sp.]
MKKTIAILMVITVLFAFAACSNTAQNEPETQTTEPQTQSTSNTSTEPSSENSIVSSGKTLVVYFSASGNTENAANYIAKATNGDLFELEPKDAYTDDDLNWRDESSRVNYEHENESARDIELVSSTVDNWDEYDTVFIGYPIWWQIAAWPVDNFVKNNNFTGKTVVPFCTSTSSGLGESGKLLEEMAGTGNWLDGERFSESVSESDVKEWIETLKA